MDLGLTDKVAIVTGGSRGIGRSIALAFAAEGCRVAICARTEEALRATCRRFRRLFQRVEETAREQGRDLREMEMAEKLTLWDDAKTA